MNRRKSVHFEWIVLHTATSTLFAPSLRQGTIGTIGFGLLTTGDEGIFHQRSFIEILHPLTDFIELLDFR